MSYFRHGDPLDDFEAHDREQQQELDRLPVCDGKRCGKRIDEDYYFEIDGEILCEACMISRYRRNTENYQGG